MINIIIKLGIVILASIFGFIGLGFLIATLYLFLVSLINNMMLAALICSVILLVVALLLFLSTKLIKRKPKQNFFLASFTDFLKDHLIGSALLALSTGFLLVTSSQIRKQFLQIIASSLKLATLPKNKNKLLEAAVAFVSEHILGSHPKPPKDKEK